MGPGLDHSWGTAGTDQRGLSAPVGAYIQGLSLGHIRGERRKAAIQQTVCNHKLLSDDTAGTPHHLQHRCAAAQPSAPGGHKTQLWVTFRNVVQPSPVCGGQAIFGLEVRVKHTFDRKDTEDGE